MFTPLEWSVIVMAVFLSLLLLVQCVIQTLDQKENTRGFFQMLVVMTFILGLVFISLLNSALPFHALHPYRVLTLAFGVLLFDNLLKNNKTLGMLALQLFDWICGDTAADTADTIDTADTVDTAAAVFFVEIFIISFFFLSYPIFHPVFHV